MEWIKSGIFLVLFLSAAWAAPVPFADDDPLRLPRTSVPVHYDIELTTSVHIGTRGFSGIVKIDVDVLENTPTLTLHNSGLTITSAKVFDSFGTEMNDVDQTNEPEKSFIHLNKLTGVFAFGDSYRIELAFTGLLATNMNGFYRSQYTVGPVTRYLASTQFESIGARRAFPCYDEPEYKATFTLAINHDSSYSAISNTQGTTLPNGDGTSKTSFLASPVMPSYLLAFVVSDFDYISNEATISSGDTLHRVYARPADVYRAQYALENSDLFLKELEDFARYEYELPKMWSAAIPDFAAGAMENWGLITYKEQYLLGDADSHPREVLDILRVTAHELGHQFFGNVVTCKWWDSIWLNEGFATLFEYLLPQRVYPNERMNDMYNVNKLQYAFRVDVTESSHPMTFDGQTTTGIIYDKAGSVIRMFQYAVGDELFRDALSLYLLDNHHKPVTSDELLAAFETTAARLGFTDFPITQAFRTWETQKSFPVVNVGTDTLNGDFIFTQQRYYAGNAERDINDRSSWYIPLNFATQNNGPAQFDDLRITDYLENTNEPTFKRVPFPESFDRDNEWFIFNKQQIGYYRVNYDQVNWDKLIAALNSPNFNDIHVLNRAQLIDDSLNLAADGYLRYETALQVLSYLERETDYIPWRAAVTNLDKLDFILKDDASYQTYRKFVKQLARKMYNKFGFEEKPGDLLVDKFARELAIDWTCRMGDERCLAETYRGLKALALENEAIPASLELTYICNGLRGLNRQDEFVALWRRMQASQDQAERIRILDGLMCAQDPKVLTDLLETTLTSSNEVYYRDHESSRIINNIYTRSAIGLSVMADFFVQFYDEFVARFGQGTTNSIILAMSRRTSSPADRTKLILMLAALAGKLSETVTEDAMKNVKVNMDWKLSVKYVNVIVVLSDYFKEQDAIESQLRLPRKAIPHYYKVNIDARNIPTGSRDFSGNVEIAVTVNEPIDYLIFHSKGQTIEDVKVLNSAGLVDIPIFDYHLYSASDTLTIYFENDVPAGTELLVRVKYLGTLLTAGTGYGFYQTSYVIDGETKYLGATNFESSVSTRYAFPQFDEPGFKAQFELSITHSNLHHAIANTYGTPSPNADGTITTRFEPTPIMSSYLNAFIVSDLASITNQDSVLPGDTLHRIWARPNAIHRAHYALDNSVAVLKALEGYVKVKFELPKCDSAAVPQKSGAMENWGMVTYRENAMIYEEDYADIPHTQALSGVDVISHELAHQFFGDLVTMEWWDYIWLNEGFATLFEYHITGILYPDWQVRDLFNVRTLHSAMRFDAGTTARPLTKPLLRLPEITGAFDTIAYGKAGSVLRMFQNAVGEDIFQSALQLYLETNQHKNVNSQHLIDAFQFIMTNLGVNDFKFEEVFRSWELQAGYPMVTVNFAANRFQITQQRHFTNKSTNPSDLSSWFIPLNFATASDHDFEDTKYSHFYPKGQDYFMIPAPAGFDGSQWYVFNKQQLGYYRVNYDQQNWNALIDVLNSDDYNQIHTLNRDQLLDDAITFAASGDLDYETVFKLLSYLSREAEYTPWFSADRFISTLYTTFGPLNADLNAFVRHLSASFYDRYKLPDNLVIPVEGVYQRYARELATKLACNAGNEQCLYDTFLTNKRFADIDIKVRPGLEAVTYCSGFRGENKQYEWVSVWRKMSLTADATAKTLMINGLGCSDDKLVLKDYLESTLGSNGNNVNYTSSAERRSVLSAVLNSNSGLEAVIDFISEFELDILNVLGYASLESLITVPARTVKTEAQQTLFMNFLETLTHLDAAASQRVRVIVDNNFAVQRSEQNAGFLGMIQKILEGLIDDTTTVEPPPDTTPAVTTPAVTTPTTPAVTTPTTPAVTTPTTPGATEESTTEGAASISIKLITLLSTLLIAFVLKY